jgi:hypothetical protein
MNKKRGEISGLKLGISIAIISILFIILLIYFASKSKSSFDFFKSFSKSYTSGETSGNAYFTAESVGMMYGGKKIETLKEGNSPCFVEGKTDTVTKIKCDFKEYNNPLPVVLYVSIKNLGFDSKEFYPMPLLCYESDIDDCKDDYVISSSPCKTDPSVSTECSVAEFIFDKNGKYNIYPGAKCLASDCNDPNDPGKDVYSYIQQPYIQVTVENKVTVENT